MFALQTRYVAFGNEKVGAFITRPKALLAKPSLPKGGGTALAVGGFRRGDRFSGGRIFEKV